MTYKMICLDIDGTLLNSDLEISPETKKAISSLPEGFPVILVSARMPKGMTFLQKELEIEMPMICYSGGLVIDPADDGSYETLLNKTMEIDHVKEVYEQGKKTNLHISFYKDDNWFVEKVDEWAAHERDTTKTKPDVASYDSLFEEWENAGTSANKIICIGDREEIEEFEKKLKRQFSEELTIYRSKANYLEIMDSSVSKTEAIKFLRKKFNAEQSEIIAIGDNFNDADMIEYAGLGGAMENSPDEVKQTADEVTASNDKNGVGKIVEKYLLGVK